MIESKEIEIDGKTFIISKCPAVAGRRIFAQYTFSAIPKIGDYDENEKTMMQLMSYVSVKSGKQTIPLSSEALIDNHVGGWETLAKLEIAMLEYNCSFFRDGKISNFFENLADKAQDWAIQTLTTLSQLSSPKD